MNDGGVCRTAPATPGLLKIIVNNTINSQHYHYITEEEKYIFNRPGVAGAVLQTPPSFIHSLIN